MVGKHPSAESIIAANEQALKSLRRAIAFSQGQFSLVLACCNYGVLRSKVLQQLEDFSVSGNKVHQVVLSNRIISLYSTIHTEFENQEPAGLMILGLESVDSLDDLLRTINHVRDEFRKRHHFPMVFWVNDGLLQKLRRFAPDFTNWAATPIRFEMTTEELRSFLRDKTDSLFAEILDINTPTDSKHLKHSHRTLGQIWDYSSYEFRCAIQELQNRGIELEPELDANLAFVSGLDDYAASNIDSAIEHFQESLKFWQGVGSRELEVRSQESGIKGVGSQESGIEGVGIGKVEGVGEAKKTSFTSYTPATAYSLLPTPFSTPTPPTPPSPHLLRQGALLFYIGLCYYRLAERAYVEHRQRWGEAKYYFQECLKVFDAAQRQDLMAQFIGLLAEVLQHLRKWDELEIIADKSQKLHSTYGTHFQLACDFGFLAQVAIAQKKWTQAAQLARVSLWQLYEAKSSDRSQLSWFPLLLAQIYRLLLAKALRHLGDHKIAKEQLDLASYDLEAALLNSDFRYNVYFYIRTLRWMRSLYFESGRYLEAFTIRQKRRSVEQQYGLRAFIGAGRLQPQRHPTTPGLSTPVAGGSVALEIIASGRERDLQSLIARISRPDQKMTVIHGPSGVGKSSIVTAGLVPALQQRAIGDQIAIPVVLQIYTDWVSEFGKALGNAMLPRGVANGAIESLSAPTSPITKAGIFELLQENARNSIITVLIFDQVEEFFFSCPSSKQQQEFDAFLCDCLNVAFVKIILTLREDYLHKLLEFKQLQALEPINDNILDKTIRYQLNNFSREDAKTVIRSLTERTQFNKLEPALIDALVNDLAAELGEVRPIELQVVGAQLQDERIFTLAKYEQFRPNKLIERYIRELISECGSENERAALLVLYLLTDENKKRPFKTRAELASELTELEDVSKLELVLEILVRSGLVVLFPDSPERYQLIHDYMVDLIRAIQQAELSLQEQVKELRQQVQQRELEIARLNSELRHNNHSLFQDTHPQTGSDLLSELKELRKREELSSIERDRLLVEIEQQKLQAELIEKEKQRSSEVKLNRTLKNFLAVSMLSIFALIISIGMAAYQWRRAIITASVAASVSSESLFALGKDIDALKEGLRAGRKLERAFLPDEATQQIVRTALYQATYGMREINRLEGHTADVNSVSYSPNSLLIASASSDYTVKLWQADGKKLPTLRGHTKRVNSVAFSPDSRILVSGSGDETVKLWNIDGSNLATFAPHDDVVNGVAFSPDGQIIASASADKTLRLWSQQGQLLTTLKGHKKAVIGVAWSPDGQILASTSSDKTVKLWNRNGQLLATLPGHGSTVLAVAWSPDGQTIASGSLDETIKLWSRDGKLLRTLLAKDTVTNVAFSPDGQTLASSSADKTVKLWSLNGQVIKVLRGHNDWVNSVSFSPDGQTLATASRDTNIKLWRWKYVPLKSIQAHSLEVTKLSFAPQGKLASASEDATVKIWSQDSKLQHTLLGHTGAVWDVNFSPDAQTIASASRDRTVKLWSQDGKLLKTLLGHEDVVLSVDWSPDGQMLASAGRDKSVRLWSRDGKPLFNLLGHSDVINWVSFSPSGQLIASASDDNTVIIWDKNNGQPVKTLRGHSRPVYAVAWSNDGKILASASLDSTVKFWSSDGEKFKSLDGNGESFMGFTFSPDSQAIATLSDDKVKLWSLDGKLQLVIKANNGETFTSITFTPDSKSLVTGSSSGKLTYHNLADTNIDNLLNESCSLLKDYLRNNTRVAEGDRALCD